MLSDNEILKLFALNNFSEINTVYSLRKKYGYDKKEAKDALKRAQLSAEQDLFESTKNVGSYILFDDNSRRFILPRGVFKIKTDVARYNYDEVTDVDLLEDGSSLTKGGLGQALAGGLLFGGVGALIGGITGTRKTKEVCNELTIKITLSSINEPTLNIKLLEDKTKKSSFIYKNAFQAAQEILSIFSIIIQTNQKDDVNKLNITDTPVLDPYEEIKKLKELLDIGIITQEEFDTKKKELLDLWKQPSII